jgi:hypothetical protein
MYSPHCGHCREVRPFWGQLLDDFSNDPRIIIGEIDCVAEAAGCSSLFESSGYPTFVQFVRGRGIRMNPTRTLEGLKAEATTIRLRNLSLPCRCYPFDFRGVYPAFVYESPVRKEASVCGLLQRIGRTVPRAARLLYLSSGRRQELSVLLSERESVSHSGRLSTDSAEAFMTDWSMVSFGHWEMKEGLRTARRFAFFVTEGDFQEQRFRAAAEEFRETVLVGAVPLELFKRDHRMFAFPPDSLIVFNLKKSRFRLFANVTDVAIFRDILSDMVIGAWEGEMQFESEKLWPEGTKGGRTRRWTWAAVAVAIAVAVIVGIIWLRVGAGIQKSE